MYLNNNFNNYNYNYKYDYNTNSLKDNTKYNKKNKKKQNHKKDKDNGGFGMFLLATLMMFSLSAAFFTCTKKGQLIFNTMKQKIPFFKTSDSLYEDNWDYGKNDNEEAVSLFDINEAQDILIAQGYDYNDKDIKKTNNNKSNNNPTTQSSTNNKTISNNKPSVVSTNENGQDTMTTYNGTELPYYHNENQNQINNKENNNPNKENSNPNKENNEQFSQVIEMPEISEPEQVPQKIQIVDSSGQPIQQEQPPQTQKPQPQEPSTQETQTTKTYEYDNDIKNQSLAQYSQFQNEINEFLIEINNVRREAGVSEVSLDMTLCEMSAYRSLDMVKRQYYGHYYEDISQLKVVINVWNRNGMHLENLAKVKANNVVTASMKGWKQSSGHYSAMINEQVTKVGIGIVKNGDYYYVTSIYS